MSSWALVYFVIALVAVALGFTGAAGVSIGLAKMLFILFLVLSVISLVTHLFRGRAF